ncbi:unnamed protein product [Closterium sp. Naga37s-1]|nr:unnamed protein product [Closterium sp. Naga37s-1]
MSHRIGSWTRSLNCPDVTTATTQSPLTPFAFPSQSPHTPLSLLPSHFHPAPQHWQHVSGVGYANFRAFLRAQRDTWRQEREASREEERRAAPAAPHADVAPLEAVAGQKAQGKVDMGEVSMGEEFDTGKAGMGVVVGELGTVQVDGMTVADLHGEEEEGLEERFTKPSAEAVAAGQSREKLEDGAEGAEGAGHRESGIVEEVAIRVSASSGAGAGVSSNADRDGERGDEGGGNEVAASAEAAAEDQGDKSRPTSAALTSDSKQQQDRIGKQKDGKQPPSPPSLPAGFTSSICSVLPEASRNVLPPPPSRPGPGKAAAAAGEAEGRKGARRGSEGAGSEGGAGKALERRRSAGEVVAGRGSGEVGPPVRMCAVFDDCLASVNKVQFARHHPDLLAYGAADGTLRLCYVPCSRGGNRIGGTGGKRGAVNVARVKHELKGHTKEVTDFDWSTDDDYLCSSSADKSVRVWDVGSGQCLRIIYTVIPQTCIIFHPQNNNFLVVANSKRELTVMNFSTGRVVSRVAMDSNVTALVADRTTSAPAAATGSATSGSSSSSSSAGGAAGKASTSAAAVAAGGSGFGGGAGEADSVVFVGDSEGAIHSFTVDKQSGALQRRHKTVAGVVHPAPVASLHFSPTSVLANGPVLLACSKDGCVRFYTTALELNGYLFLKISLQLSSRATNMNATFCPPLGPSGSGEYIVTGNADHHVYFYDFMKPRSPLVARVPVSLALAFPESLFRPATGVAHGSLTVRSLLSPSLPPHTPTSTPLTFIPLLSRSQGHKAMVVDGHKAMVVDVSWNNSNTVLASLSPSPPPYLPALLPLSSLSGSQGDGGGCELEQQQHGACLL